MILNLFRKSAARDAAPEAYRSIVAQSRQEKFYAEWGVPDTVTGRFDMISLHLSLFMHRLRGDSAARDRVQAIVDCFFRDMDLSLRELGVTDIGVPKKVKTIGNVFYGLAGVLADAIDSGDPAAVEAVLVKNVYGEDGHGAALLANYLLAESARLAAQSTDDVLARKGVPA
jgi:cytochrome b pre-mRNA-processing protein 3